MIYKEYIFVAFGNTRFPPLLKIVLHMTLGDLHAL